MGHGRPRLNVYGHQLLVDRVLHQGWSVAAAAEALQVSRQTGYRRLRRYRAEGPAGLLDRWEQRQQGQRSPSARSQMSPRARQLAAKNATRVAAANAAREPLITFRHVAAAIFVVPIFIALAVFTFNAFGNTSSIDRAPTNAECVQIMQTARNQAAVDNKPLDLTYYSLRGCAMR